MPRQAARRPGRDEIARSFARVRFPATTGGPWSGKRRMASVIQRRGRPPRLCLGWAAVNGLRRQEKAGRLSIRRPALSPAVVMYHASYRCRSTVRCQAFAGNATPQQRGRIFRRAPGGARSPGSKSAMIVCPRRWALCDCAPRAERLSTAPTCVHRPPRPSSWESAASLPRPRRRPLGGLQDRRLPPTKAKGLDHARGRW